MQLIKRRSNKNGYNYKSVAAAVESDPQLIVQGQSFNYDINYWSQVTVGKRSWTAGWILIKLSGNVYCL